MMDLDILGGGDDGDGDVEVTSGWCSLERLARQEPGDWGQGAGHMWCELDSELWCHDVTVKHLETH